MYGSSPCVKNEVNLNYLNPKSDWHRSSPHNSTAKSSINIMRIQRIIANPRSFDYQMISPCQYQKKCIEESMENVDVDVRV